MSDEARSTRYLGVDYGLRRIGLAVSDPGGRIASPLATLTGKRPPVDAIRALLNKVDEDYDIDEFVVGLPLNMDGSEGPQARQTRQFAEELRRRSSRPVHLWDERLSSWTAESALRDAGLTRGKRKARVDRVAAQVILQSFLDHLGKDEGQMIEDEG